MNDATVETSDDATVVIETLVPSQVTSELSAIDCQTLLNKEDSEQAKARLLVLVSTPVQLSKQQLLTEHSLALLHRLL